MTAEEVRREKETRRNVKTREVKRRLPLYLFLSISFLLIIVIVSDRWELSGRYEVL